MFQSIVNVFRGKPQVHSLAFPASTVDDLVAESQALGAQIDVLRERRKDLAVRIAAMLKSKHATVAGQALIVDVKREG
jgi:hypothetical protein